MIDDNDSNLTDKENFQMRVGAGSIDCFGGRRFGKTHIVEKCDLFLSILHLDGEYVGFSSYDAVHIRGILEDVIKVLENHTLFKMFKPKVNRAPSYRITFCNGYVLDGINMNIMSKSPGSQFFQKHLDRLYIEEACVDGHTKIRYIDNGEVKSKNISELINSEDYKNIEVFSYNENTQLVEPKAIKNVFKKACKDCNNYKFYLNKSIGSNNRTITVSENHRLFVNGKYINPSNVKVGDKMYLLDGCELSQTQKEVLVGCLLGDSHLNKGNLSSLSFTNSIKQEDYLNYKMSCFESFFETYRKTKNKRKELKKINSIGDIRRYTSKEVSSLCEFNNFKYNRVNNFYTKIDSNLLEKYLSAKSLAFFVMDDGSIGSYKCKKSEKINNYIYLHTEAFDLDTQNLIVDIIQKKFGIIGKVSKSKKYYYISFDSENTEKLIGLIKNYIHPSMLYKINTSCNEFINLSDNKYLLEESEIIKIEKSKKSSWTMYCLEVKDNHNFFANGILTGNSFETKEVYEKRLDAVSENGCVVRAAGMTNFTKYSPSGTRFYDLENRAWVCNLPQYCVAEGSKVLMSDLSTRNIENIQIGDEILTLTEKAPYKMVKTKVTNKVFIGEKETIKLNNGYNDLLLTPDHKLLHKSGKWNRKWTQAKDLKDDSEVYYIKRFVKDFITNFTIKSLSKSPVTKEYGYKNKVYDLTTEAHSFIANGYVVHNCNPKWNEKEKQEAIRRHGGENSISYRIFVKGEVVEEGISVFDMERVRRNYLEKKVVKAFEITKDNFHDFRNILVVDRPQSIEAVHIDADIGESAPTEIIITFKSGNAYKLVYRVTCYNLTEKQQPEIFIHLTEQLKANYIGIDTTDGTGRSIFRTLNQRYPSENLVWCAFNEKINVGFKKDDKDNVICDEKGNPIIEEEYVAEWSIKRLKDLLYGLDIHVLKLPVDYQIDKQLNSVVSTQSGARTVYSVVGEEDHLLAAMRVFAISQWQKEFASHKPIVTKKFSKSGV
jgi:hypothetical protein